MDDVDRRTMAADAHVQRWPGLSPWQGGRDLRVRAMRGAASGAALRHLFAESWPSWRRWYLRDGPERRPTLDVAQRALRLHMPELVPVWEELVAEVSDGDEMAARFLTQFDPPALVRSCSTAVLPGGEPGLARNYDYDPDLFDAVVLETALTGRRVIGMSDQLWGLLDGVNDSGLAAAFTFGGRREVGPGFGIPLVLRYLLETCDAVASAVAALARIPVHLAYNVALLDRSGAHATVFVGPGRAPVVTDLRASTNHQGSVDWPEHARYVRSVERLETLHTVLHAPGASPEGLLAALTSPPLRARDYGAGFGTLYTATYLAAAGTASYHWPGSSWRQSFEAFEEGERWVRLAD